MKTTMSYLVKLENGTMAWLAVGKEVPAGAEIVEERPMMMPDEGKALKHKTTGAISSGHWLREGSAEDWEEIEEPKEQGAE
jgi:hypothetical protein